MAATDTIRIPRVTTHLPDDTFLVEYPDEPGAVVHRTRQQLEDTLRRAKEAHRG